MRRFPLVDDKMLQSLHEQATSYTKYLIPGYSKPINSTLKNVVLSCVKSPFDQNGQPDQTSYRPDFLQTTLLVRVHHLDIPSVPCVSHWMTKGSCARAIPTPVDILIPLHPQEAVITGILDTLPKFSSDCNYRFCQSFYVLFCCKDCLLPK